MLFRGGFVGNARTLPFRSLMQGIQFNSIRRFCGDRYVIERRICLLAAAVRCNGVATVDDLIRLNEYGIGPHVAALLKANTAQPAPAFD
jgi:hypothetical protein